MADGYDVDPDGLTAVGGGLGAADATLAGAAGSGTGADAGTSTQMLLLVAGLQADTMAALGQALARSADETTRTAAAYRDAEVTASALLPGGG